MEHAYVLLNDSDAYKKYEEFDKVTFPDNYVDSFNEALSMEHDIDKIKELCGKLAGNLKKISKSKESQIKNDESCGYLHFWLYHKIYSYFKDNPKIRGITDNIIDGGIIFNNSISNNNCSFRYSSNIDLKKWIEGKHLHDYFENFEYIKKTYGSNDNKCEEYNKYIKAINTFYQNYKNEYYYDHEISRFLLSNESGKYDPNNLISEINCKIEKPPMLSQTHQPPTREDTTEHGGTTSVLPSKDDDIDNPSYGSNSSSITGVSVSLIGMFIFFFTSYKFTPLGSWINGKIFKSAQIHDNIDNVTNNMLEDHSEYMNINNNSSTFNIAYNPE
ncbi:PIR Superfamily Protein [Plasmodium ovale wallikeri]|uniref:PIR Superfamily Protein n=1 Tax=Plasmodium ovale wallikeri TaxID=864142 RepID=A0A1A9AJM8_PLAOA|nr:PIR Superfamily Protein [Plasmodium ovale wallikeri]SBT56299.1 PIR Superfamily Protein [Plasmodium ovale wallikeri]